MGLFSFIGKVVTLPVKVVAAPVRILEKTFEDRPALQPINNATKSLTKSIEKTFEELDD